MKTINIITLGCSKNVVDSERIMAQILAMGWSVEFDSTSTHFDVVVVNTCGFIGDAKQESINMILECVEAKNRGELRRLYVIGCLSERYADELREEIPEVDDYFGVRSLDDIVNELGGEWQDELNRERHLTTPSHYAYLKISEGCNWGCSYCAIPLIRGKHISVPIEDLVDETRKLVAKGVRELMIIAQDTTYYGMDLYGERRLGSLLRALCDIEGVEWVRLHYAYPTNFPQDVIDALAQEPKMCKYLDIPLQHIADSQLNAMRRGIDKARTKELITRLRDAIPNIAIRTTMLVGFPGESESDFEELMEFVRETKFERLGVFPYSEEEGTYAAQRFENNVPEKIKQQRVERLMELQSEISRENNLSMIGRQFRVIIDRTEGDSYIGRTEYDSPEVDQEVIIPFQSVINGVSPLIGEFVQVCITASEEYDLYGRIL